MQQYRPLNEFRVQDDSWPRHDELLNRDDIDEVSFRFTDLDGRWIQFHKRRSALSSSDLLGGLHFSCSLPGWRGIHASDYLIKPDHSTLFVDGNARKRSGSYICDVWEPHGLKPYRRDPRWILKSAIARLNDLIPGATALVGPELEFYLLRNATYDHSKDKSFLHLQADQIVGDGPIDNRVEYKRSGPSGHLTPEFDSCARVRRKIIDNLSKAGISVNRHHHELGPGQNEISIVHLDALHAADSVQIYKHVVRSTAVSESRLATFMPMPFAATCGSGLHYHLSFCRDEKNLFATGDRSPRLSDIGMFAIGGILKHARALSCFLNPTVNSYRRLYHAFGANRSLSYGHLNRRTILRIPPATSAQGRRIEVRFGDATSNPYLAIASLVMAMLDGIEKRINPGPPVVGRLPKRAMDTSERADSQLAFDLREAIQALDEDRAFLTIGNVFFDSLINSHLTRLAKRVDESMKYPHPLEFAECFEN